MHIVLVDLDAFSDATEPLDLSHFALPDFDRVWCLSGGVTAEASDVGSATRLRSSASTPLTPAERAASLRALFARVLCIPAVNTAPVTVAVLTALVGDSFGAAPTVDNALLGLLGLMVKSGVHLSLIVPVNQISSACVVPSCHTWRALLCPRENGYVAWVCSRCRSIVADETGHMCG
jgi:hypothetical protein